MKLITETIQEKLDRIIEKLAKNEIPEDIEKQIRTIQQKLFDAIPDKKRISYGRVHTIKTIAKYIYDNFKLSDTEIIDIIENLFDPNGDYRAHGVWLGVLSHAGQKQFDRSKVYLLKAGNSDNFDIRELAQMNMRKLIHSNKDAARKFLMDNAKSDNPNIRRFVSESLRPVVESRWMQQNPEYSLEILDLMFQENDPYPRSSVGNNLSDLARGNPELILETVKKLVDTGDSNSLWIAKRACRNLIKKYPVRVFDILGCDEYRYKKNVYYRKDYE